MDQTNCSDCGKKVYKSLKYCPYCGKKQTKSFSKAEIDKNPYKVLQIASDAEPEVVDAAYKSLSKKYHPDIDTSPNAQEKMKEINWAYSVLSNPQKRKEWDESQKNVESKKSSPPTQKTSTNRNEQSGQSNPTYVKKNHPRKQKTASSPPIRKEKGLNPGKSALIAIVILIIIPLCFFGFLNAQSTPSARNSNQSQITKIPTTIKRNPTPTPIRPTRTPKPPTATPVVSNTSSSFVPSCFHWSDITPALVGRTICVYGNVHDLYSTNQISTRIKFTSKPNTFFIYDANYIYPDLRRGDCVSAEERIQLFDNRIPFMAITALYKCEPWMK